jgi:type IV pilus assembly protein PilM
MRPVFADLVQEIQRSLGYYQSLNRDANLTRLVGVGSTFRLPGLQKFLKQQLQVDVIRPDGFKRLTVENRREADFADHALNMATAYGLALQGLELETVSANILPAQILKQRQWRSKQPWIGAAAACIALASGLAGARYFADAAAFNATITQANDTVRPVLNRAQRYVSEMLEITSGSDPRLRMENLRRVLDYRQLNPQLMEDLTLAAAAVNPQPETLQADYGALKSIPRPQRQRLYIETVKSEYLVGPSGTQAGAGRVSAGGGLEERLGKAFTADDFWPDSGMSDSSESTDSGEPAAESEAPRFVITVTGTTPYAEAATLLSQQYLGWLQRNAERADRPYRIEVDPRPGRAILTLGPVEQDRRTTPGRPGPNAMPPGAWGPPGAIDMPGFAPGGDAGVGFRGTSTRSLEELFPKAPWQVEDRSQDKRFQVQWTVELLRPEQTRRAENASPPPEPEPGSLPAPEPELQAQPPRAEQRDGDEEVTS